MSTDSTVIVEQGSVRFSVVIPTRCRPGLVMQAVQSVLRQTVGAHEVVMIIDGMDPSTERALRSFPAVTVVARRRTRESRRLATSVCARQPETGCVS